jgi:peptide/nickel transport system permease protein
MWRHLASRLVQIPLILIVVTMTIFIVVRSTPGDPVQIMLGMETSPDAVAAIRKEFRLDRPVPVQYVLWLGDPVQGNLGRSIRLNTPVTQLLTERLPVSLRLAVGAMSFALCISIPFGILAALYRNTWIDYVCTGYTVAGFAIPNFALAMILIYVFSIKLGWFPITGIGSGDENTALGAIAPYVLPAVAPRRAAPPSSSS